MLPRAIARHGLFPVYLAAAAGALLALVTAVPTLAAAPGATQPAVRYVALGDSYSSGVGAGSYLSSGGSCDRSADAYPALWAAARHPASYVSEACASATTASVVSSQVSALSTATTLVSLTVGGNDAGFVPVMTTCVLLPASFCAKAVSTAEAVISGELPAELNRVLAAISARAPSARVVVLGYPQPYDLSRSSSCIGLSTASRTDLNQAAGDLDAQLKAAALRYHDAFADVRGGFAGHEICDPSRWLNAVDWLDLGASYHPTAAGQAAYERAFSAAAG